VSSEAQTWGFYLPVMFAMVGVSTMLGNNLILMLIYGCATIAAWVAPTITPKVGQRGVGMIGFGIVLPSLLLAGWALHTGHTAVLPLAALTMWFGQSIASSNPVTIASLVAKPEYRGTAVGFSYMWFKLAAFLGIFLFPSVFIAIGQANSSLLVAVFPVVGLLCAIFLLPEVYGFEHD
jgi:MFS family permease